MNNLRFWIAVLALTCFGAGVGAGSFLSLKTERNSAEPKPFAEYRERFVRQFELSPERAQQLDLLLDNYARSIEDVEQQYLARSLSDMEQELEALGVRYHGYIRDSVLPRSRRAEFDALSEGLTWPRSRL